MKLLRVVRTDSKCRRLLHICAHRFMPCGLKARLGRLRALFGRTNQRCRLPGQTRLAKATQISGETYL